MSFDDDIDERGPVSDPRKPASESRNTGLQKSTGERRYDDDEIGLILAKATETKADPQRSGSAVGGLTLSELEDIGREVGVDPSLIRQAAHALDTRPTVLPRKRSFGLPIGVGRTVELPGELSDGDWERLVVRLRETFDAKGQVRQEGNLRQWTNGNLQALVEPTESGQRLRLRTLSARFRSMLGLGTAGTAMGVVFAGLAAVGGASLPDMLMTIGVGFGLGAWGFGTVILQSFKWADERELQMEAVAQYALELAGDHEARLLPKSEHGTPAGDGPEVR